MMLKYRLNTGLLLNFVHKRVYQNKAKNPEFNQSSLAKLGNISPVALSRATHNGKITIATLEKVLSVLRMPKSYMGNIFISEK